MIKYQVGFFVEKVRHLWLKVQCLLDRWTALMTWPD